MFGHSPLALFTHEDIEILRKPIWVAFHVITQFVLFYQRICPVISISCTSRPNKYIRHIISAVNNNDHIENSTKSTIY